MENSRELYMTNVVKYIEYKYNGKKFILESSELEVFKGFVLLSFPNHKLPLKIVSYKITLDSGDIIQVLMELVTGYISLKGESTADSIKKIHEIDRELILVRGITNQDIEEKNMFYHHYISAKRDSEPLE